MHILGHVLRQELPGEKAETMSSLTCNPVLSLQGFLGSFLSSLLIKDQLIIGSDKYAGKYCGLNNNIYLGFFLY